MKRENKVWERIAAVITVLLTLTVISCSNGSDVTTSSLQDLLSTTEKTTVDLSSEVFELSDSSSIVLSKAITLSGGASQYDLKGATLTVKSAGTIVENVTNVAELIIDESVGDGDFTLSNSSVAKLTVNGGGSNSIHLNGTAIATVTVAKEGVRLVLEGSTTVAAVDLQAACVLDSTSETAVISAVTIASSVKSVTLKGKANITAISASSKEVKVTVASNDVKVATTVVKDPDGTVNTITLVPASEDIKVPETKLPEGEKKVEKKTYTVTFESEYDSAKPIKVEENSSLTAEQLPSLKKDGYAFEGWYIDNTKVEAGYKVTKDITLKAKWKEKSTYTVSYSTAHGSVKAIEVTKNGKLTAEQLPSLTDDDYLFEGWYIGATKIEPDYAVTKDLLLTAKWKEKTVINGITITVEGGDSTNDEDRIDVTWEPAEGNNNYIILKATPGYSSYHWTFMGTTVVQTTGSTGNPEQYKISFYPYSDGTYAVYLYVPDGEHVGKSATIYFDVNRQ